MAKVKEKTKYTGVRYVEHSTRKHGVRFDRAFYIRYMLNGKEKEECAGWASAGMTAEKASLLRAELMQAHNLAIGEAKSLGERRERAEQQKQIEENKFTLQKAWDTYIETYPDKKSLRSEKYILQH